MASSATTLATVSHVRNGGSACAQLNQPAAKNPRYTAVNPATRRAGSASRL
jgi:hypothetical protein